MSKRDIARSCSLGLLTHLRRGVYAARSADPEVVAAALHGGALACASVLRRRDVWTLEDGPRVHVWLGVHGRAHPHSECACVAHWDGPGSALGIVSLIDALVQSADCLGAEAFFAAFESAWHQGLLTRRDRAAVRARLAARHRHLVDLARPDAESGLESIVRLRLARLGIRARCQVRIDGIGRVDFVIADRIILEIDGRENHDGQSMRHKDLRRDALASALGYTSLRYDYALVMHEWGIVEAAILGALSRVA